MVIVSDVGLVTKASPGQMLMFAANRHTGEPRAGCEVRVLAAREPVGDGGRTSPTASARRRQLPDGTSVEQTRWRVGALRRRR